MNSAIAFAPFAVPALLLAALTAQDQATTLLANARAADAVVVARVLGASDPSPDWHRLQFQTVQLLKGALPSGFALLEPAGACCGRSLFVLQPGDVRLLFLARRGPTLHPLGGARGVADGTPATIAHVQALLAAPGDAAAARVLAQALGQPEPRIADDAAQALAALPGLALAGAEADLVVAALQRASELGTTNAAPLAEVAVRLGTAPVLDAMLPLYLDAPRADHAALLRRALARGDASAVATRLPQFVGDDQRAVRAAELLVELPAEQARPALDALLARNGHPRLHLCIAERLLAAGAVAAELVGRVPAPVLELARQRHATRPRFRTIDPTRR